MIGMIGTKKKTRRRSPRGNWLVVEFQDGKIQHCTWVHTWAGAQASKRHKEAWLKKWAKLKRLPIERVGRVMILGANEINDLYKLWEMSGGQVGA